MLAGPRVKLRGWTDADCAPFAALCADPRVMRHFPKLLSRADTDAFIDRALAHHAAHGFGTLVLEVPGIACAGFVGLWHVPWDAPFTPAVEIGWRLAEAAWGQGYATEAASLCLADGFSRLGLAQVVAFTVPANLPSIAVMRRLGMRPDGDFQHPRLPEGHALRRHLLYRIDAPAIGDRARAP